MNFGLILYAFLLHREIRATENQTNATITAANFTDPNRSLYNSTADFQKELDNMLGGQQGAGPVEDDSSYSDEGNPFEDLLTPEHESYRVEGEALEDLYCSEVIRFFPGWYCAQEGYFGEGGNGYTFIVNNGTEKEYMLKVQKDKSERGFKALLDVQGHINIIEVIKAEYVNEHLIVIIEFADFGNLKSYMGKNRSLFKNQTYVLEIFDQILDGISYVHAKNIVHADIKLGNIVVDKYRVPKIIDFDLCVRRNEKKGGRGTSQYMAPEVYKVWGSSRRPYNGKEDVYSLAITLYYMLNKNFPFHGSGRKNVWALINKKTFLVKAGTPLEIAKIYERSFVFRNSKRADMKELQTRVHNVMKLGKPSKFILYDETLSTDFNNFYFEEMRERSTLKAEIKAAILAIMITFAIYFAMKVFEARRGPKEDGIELKKAK